MEKVLYRVEFRRIWWQKKYVYIALFGQLRCDTFVMYGAVVQYKPLLYLFFLYSLLSLPFPLVPLNLSDPGKHLLYKVNKLTFPKSSLDDPPVAYSVLGYNCYQTEALTLGDRAVDGNLLIRTCPRLVSSHVEVEAGLI